MDEDLTQIDQRTLRMRRDAAADRVRYAGYGALGSAALTALLFLWIAYDAGEGGGVRYMGIGPLAQALLAVWLLRRRSQLAAAGLIVALVATYAYLWTLGGAPSNLLGVVGFGYLYFNGVRGALDYPELDAELARRDVTSTQRPAPAEAAG